MTYTPTERDGNIRTAILNHPLQNGNGVSIYAKWLKLQNGEIFHFTDDENVILRESVQTVNIGVRDVLFLKFGRIKDWGGLKSDKALTVMNEILTNDLFNDKMKIIELINACQNGVFILDFYDKKITRKKAIEYIEESA